MGGQAAYPVLNLIFDAGILELDGAFCISKKYENVFPVIYLPPLLLRVSLASLASYRPRSGVWEAVIFRRLR